EIGLVPEARVGAVVLCNLDGTSFPAAILYRALDAYLGAPPRDWSAVLLAAERKAEARGDSVDKAFEAKRVRDTHPSLPLERYAGNYVDSLYGTVEIAEQGDRLVARMGPAFTGDLTHWHFDTFKVTWRDRGLGTSYLTFNVDVAIQGDRIARIAPPGLLAQAAARRRIDAHGLVVAPGIIDIQAQSDAELLRGDSRVISMVTQGVTTMIMGEGETPAPAND